MRNDGQRYCDEHHAKANSEYRKRSVKKHLAMKGTLQKVVDYFKKNPEALTDEMKQILTLYKQNIIS